MNPLVRKAAKEELGDCDRIHIIEPLEVIDFHNFLSRSYLILTDSGGIQEEAPSLGKPVLVLRDTTERPEGIKAGTLKLVGTDERTIYDNFKLLLEDTAINKGKQISFFYYHYNQYREEVPNNDGKRYRFSPYYLVWNKDHYYAVGFCEKHQRITTFRVDRMKSISILCSDAVPQPKDFNLPDFTRQVFDMYDGEKEKVMLLCKNELMNYIIDKFGEEVETSPTDGNHFKAIAEVSVSQTFFAWVFQFNGDIKITGPSSVVSRYREMLESALK